MMSSRFPGNAATSREHDPPSPTLCVAGRLRHYLNTLLAWTLFGEAKDGVPLRGADLLNRESIALLKQGHSLELGLCPELSKRHVAREALDCLDVHHRPVRLPALA